MATQMTTQFLKGCASRREQGRSGSGTRWSKTGVRLQQVPLRRAYAWLAGQRDGLFKANFPAMLSALLTSERAEGDKRSIRSRFARYGCACCRPTSTARDISSP